jgi:[acyl-carrier-protein] S-malonyltransferase
VDINVPEIPTLQNYGLVLTSADTSLIRDNLIKQIYNPVPWVETIQSFSKQGISTVCELGPGRVLGGLNRSINREMKVISINNDGSLRDALEHCASI